MRLFVSRAIWLTVLFVPLLVGLLRGEGSQDPDAERIAGLVRQLGSGVFAKRQEANHELLKLGEKALPALQTAASKPSDLESRRRVEELIDTLTPKIRKSPTIDLEMLLIPKGSFAMGSPVNERNRRLDEMLHSVRISKPYYLGKYEVTQEEYQKVMDASPSWFSANGDGTVKILGEDTKRFPVENVSWFDAIEFCNRLSKKDGLAPFYQIREATRRENGSIKSASVAILGGAGYRLPTEAEWEYACREWTAMPYHFGQQNSGREANLKPGPGAGGYGGAPSWRTLDRTTRVGSYTANRWGLHDMHGNASEWCWDWYDKDYYANSPAIDPNGPGAGTHRVVRSGSWLVSEVNCRSASRFYLPPGDATYYSGFRIARNP